jgi:hypothetical protein
MVGGLASIFNDPNSYRYNYIVGASASDGT